MNKIEQEYEKMLPVEIQLIRKFYWAERGNKK